MKYIILFIVLYFASICLVFSNPEQDSLVEELNKHWRLAGKLSATNSDSSRLVYFNSIKISEKLDDGFYKGFSLSNYAVALNNLSLYSSAIDTLKLAYKYSRSSDSAYLKVYTLSQIGTTYKDMGMFDSAFVYYNRAENEYDFLNQDLKESNRRTLLTASILFTDLGLLYHRIEYFKEALNYFDKALHIAIKLQDRRRIAGTYINMANVYSKKDYYDSTKMLNYYRRGQYICEEIGHQRYLSRVYGNLVNVFVDKKMADSAYFYYDKAKSLMEELKDYRAMTTLYESYTELLALDNKPNEQIKFLLKGYSLSRKYNQLYTQRLFTSKLSSFYKKTGDFNKAFEYQEEFIRLQDSLFDQSLNDKLMQIRISTIQDKKTNEISLINKEKQLLAAQNQSSTIINISLSVGSLLLMVAAFFLYRANKQKGEYSSQLEMKNEELDALIEDLSKSQKELEATNQSKDKLFSIIAHDLKNPLSTFITVTDILGSDFEDMDDAEKKDFISDLNKSSKSLYSLLENLLFWSRSQMGVLDFNPLELDANYLVSQTVELLEMQAQKKSIKVEKYLQDNVMVTADANMLLTVTRNILSNSIKFTPKDGKITVSTGFLKNYVYIRIEDTGLGIPKDKIKLLFEPSNTKSSPGTDNEQGTGLGLVLCKEFIDKHDGMIEVESEVMKGSIFTILIPKAI